MPMLEHIAEAGATPFIAFKSNSTIDAVRHNGFRKTRSVGGHVLPLRVFVAKTFFLQRYHRRSNVEVLLLDDEAEIR